MAAFSMRRAAALVLMTVSLGAQAALFADDEARQEIIKLRPQVENLRRSLAVVTEELRKSEEARRNSEAQQSQAQAQQQQEALQLMRSAMAKSADEQSQLRRGLLELANQLETLRRELTQLRGENEQMVHFVAGVQRGLQDMKRGQADLQMAIDGLRSNIDGVRSNIDGVRSNIGEMQRNVNDVSSGVEARIRRIEPVKVNVDGREFEALPAEISAFDAALAVMRKGEFAAARTAFEQFQARYPTSGYRSSALYWLGNAQYATREYKEAMGSLRRMLQLAPDHPRAAEAMLTIANSQIELKEPRATVRRTLEDLVKTYPQDEAAATAKERLSKLK
jgi:tol-pal system protein YbgF